MQKRKRHVESHKNCVLEDSCHVARTRPLELSTVQKNPNITDCPPPLDLTPPNLSPPGLIKPPPSSQPGSDSDPTMLKLNANYPLIPNPTRVCNNKLSSYYDASSIVKYGDGCRKLVLTVSVKAVEDEGSGGGSTSFPERSWDPSSEIEVPSEQRPVNEYSSLKDGILYSWGELGPSQFFFRLGGLWLVTFTVLGVPIAAASFNPSREPLRFILAAGTGTLFLVALVVLRIYCSIILYIQGWSYVGDRLLSAVVPYEESGWYDGQMWVKPPEVSIAFHVFSFVVSAVMLFIFATPVEDFFKNALTAKENLIS